MHKQPSSIPKQLHEPEISTTIPGYHQNQKDVTLNKPWETHQKMHLNRPSPGETHPPRTPHTGFSPDLSAGEAGAPSAFSALSRGSARGSVPPSPRTPAEQDRSETLQMFRVQAAARARRHQQRWEGLLTSQRRHRQDIQGTAGGREPQRQPNLGDAGAEGGSTGAPRTVYGDRTQRGLTFEKLCSVPRCFAGNKGQDGVFVGAPNSRFSWGSIKWVEFTLPWYNSSDCVRIAPGMGHTWLVFLITSLPS